MSIYLRHTGEYLMDVMRKIRKSTKLEEIDYLFLLGGLASYKRPRDKITSLLKKEEIIRVKKGVYIFGSDYRQRPYSLEVLANMIYGPSYISYESALSYYGMIPERITRITSACFKRVKYFHTPVGEFIYYYLDQKKFSVGITWESINENTHFFIATREKALADYLAKQNTFSNQEELSNYLMDGMRIDFDDIKSLRKPLMKDIAILYQNTNVDLLCKIIEI